MAKYSSKDVGFLLIDGYDVLSVTTQIEDARKVLTEETTPLGATWEQHESVDLYSAEFRQEGYFDDASDSVHDALNSTVGSSRVLCYNLEGNTVGQKFTGYSGAMQVDYTPIATNKGLTRANASYQGSGIVEQGLILHAHSAETADGDTEDSSVDGGEGNAPSEDGGSAYLQVSAITLGGYDSVTIKVRDSADDVTYGDLVSMTNVTTAPTAERKTVSGNVERYLAVSWTFNGAGSDPSITFMVGFKRN